MTATVLLSEEATDPFVAAEHDNGALVALLDGCANPGVTRQGLLVRLADLPPALARPHHLRLIAAAIDPLLGLDRARLFQLADSTLVLIWRGEARHAVQQACATLATMFDGAPGRASDPMALPLELPRDTQQVAAAITRSVARAPDAPSLATRPLDPASLAGLEAALAQADVSPFSRRKPVCRWPAEGVRSVAWERRSLSISELARVLAPGRDPRSDIWLFRRLTRTLDRRMLALLGAADELRDAGPFALDLNVASILAPEFLRFDATLPGALRGEVILNLLPADILADAEAYEFARDFARTRGYRLLLRGVTAGWLTALPPDLLGIDLVELRATPGLSATERLPAGIDPERVVLSDVGDTTILDWGRRQGIPWFRGRLIRR